MLKLFKNMSIKGKVVTSFTVCNIALVILIVIVLAVLNKTCGNYEEAYSNYGEVASTTAYSMSAYENLIGNLEKAVIQGENSDVSDILKTCMDSAADMQESFEEIAPMLYADEQMTKVVDAGILEKYKAAEKAYNAEAAAFQTIYMSLKQGNIADARTALLGEDFEGKAAAVTKTFTDLYEAASELGHGRLESLAGNKNTTAIMIVVILLVVVTIVIVMAFTLSRSIKIPVASMREGADALANGDVNCEIKHFYNDEIGALADSLTKMQSNIKSHAEVAKQLSEGDFSMDVTSSGPKDILGNAIVTMVKEENRVMSGIREAVMEIKTGSSEVASASQSLAQGSTEQASAIQQITASITDINERTRLNAEDATKASNLVSKAKDDAADSNMKMKDMIDAMTDINRSSENISKIIKVIDDIAFQTNILALNAAVEAARAGAHGRGFAVVADEVRNLAGKSAQAASETAELIEDSIAKVEKGSRLAEETAAALDGIVAAIDKIVTITNAIAVASNDQATAINQIDQAIGQVSQVVQTNSATSEQCAAASEELSAQAAKLREMIGRYKLKETAPINHTSSIVASEPIGLPDDDDDFDNTPVVISLDEGFGKY